MSEVSLMITITERAREDRFRKLYAEHGATVTFGTYGQGTAPQDILDVFGLEESEKSVLHTLVTEEIFREIRKDLQTRFRIDVPGTGIVFTIPLSAVGGKKQLKFLLGDQEFEKEEESVMKATQHELIVVISNQGYTDMIMEAAQGAGVGGGTVIRAKGTGLAGAEKFFGFSIADEKDMVYMVVQTGAREAVMRAIMDQSGMRSKAQAVCFSMPVSQTAGMRLIEPQGEDEE